MKASYTVYEAYWGGEWICEFKLDGRKDLDERGTNGTGGKIYKSKESAIAAGKRYISKMKKMGFQ